MKTPSVFLSFTLAIALGIGLYTALQRRADAAPPKPTPMNKSTSLPADTPYIVLGMGCFWGAERRMGQLPGVLDVESGYAGGDKAGVSYEDTHAIEQLIRLGSTATNAAEVVKVYYDPKKTTLESVLIQFWQSHDPTQGNRQGNDVGSTYRSAIFFNTVDEKAVAEKTRAVYQSNLQAAGLKKTITTEIAHLRNYTTAEDYHQNYLQKNPNGYCGLGGTGVKYQDSRTPVNKK